MPIDDLYWNSIDFGSEEEEPPSLIQTDPLPSLAKTYVDPWDLENYAYIREQMVGDSSIEMSITSSDPCSSGEFAAEANSTSFYYVPAGVIQHSNQLNNITNSNSGNASSRDHERNYMVIDEVKKTTPPGYEDRMRRPRSEEAGVRSVRNEFDSEFEDCPYEDSFRDTSLFYPHQHETNNIAIWRKVAPVSTDDPASRIPRDRSLSFSYGDSYGYDSFGAKPEIYSRLEEVQPERDSTLPIQNDRRNRTRKPRNFGLSNYGHLKIDYSYSWNNLDKYICK